MFATSAVLSRPVAQVLEVGDLANELFAEAIARATAAGKSLDAIDETIIEPATLTTGQKGALFLFAYSLRQRGEQRRYARESLAMTGMPPPGSPGLTARRAWLPQ